MMYVMRVFISIQSSKYPTNLKKVSVLLTIWRISLAKRKKQKKRKLKIFLDGERIYVGKSAANTPISIKCQVDIGYPMYGGGGLSKSQRKMLKSQSGLLVTMSLNVGGFKASLTFVFELFACQV